MRVEHVLVLICKHFRASLPSLSLLLDLQTAIYMTFDMKRNDTAGLCVEHVRIHFSLYESVATQALWARQDQFKHGCRGNSCSQQGYDGIHTLTCRHSRVMREVQKSLICVKVDKLREDTRIAEGTGDTAGRRCGQS